MNNIMLNQATWDQLSCHRS